MSALGSFPSGIRLNESFVWTLQFTNAVNAANPSVCRFDFALQRFAGDTSQFLAMSSDPGGGLTIGPMDPVALTYTVAAKINNIGLLIPPGTYVGFLRCTDPTGFAQDLVVFSGVAVIPY